MDFKEYAKQQFEEWKTTGKCSDAVRLNKWYNQNGLIVNAVSQNYNLVSNDNYYVIVTNSNGCSSYPQIY